ncbi:glycosyltransferase family 2 protein [Pseudobutyrivibrio xylanivorans]|uniref:Glycosyltransferase involved in cell wall bisynthesis n=1 Tax=Pseudobutyrivibrio xylanivorans DSM 14809 TaxID=1123012 RepID=A0A1M6I337_PSEXY|nr:glycosyltransferase family 2 protein [Pseudobutyrivibrio xylanivorans]SHJ28832.1 Glycosyltransferase involved in cell wall bisynthesis [Pseudobutyrivibrio xylanivorans DSM 14809]
MISVIIPVYNVEKYLERCINSILSQTYKNVEIVLVDDGSKDSSPQICDDFSLKHDNIKVIHIPNGGVSNARNLGIKEAKGEWITFVDADDYLDLSHLEVLNNSVESNVDLGVCDYKLVSENGEVIQARVLTDEFPNSFSKIQALEDMGRGTSVWGYVWNKLFKKELIISNDIWFDSDIKIWEDMLFCAEYISYCEKVFVAQNSSYNYVVREGSAVNSTSFTLISTKYTACEKFEILLDGLINKGILSENSQFSIWVKTVFAETCLYGIINGQFKNRIYDKKLIDKYLSKVKKYKKYINVRQRVELDALRVCPYIIYILKRE